MNDRHSSIPGLDFSTSTRTTEQPIDSLQTVAYKNLIFKDKSWFKYPILLLEEIKVRSLKHLTVLNIYYLERLIFIHSIRITRVRLVDYLLQDVGIKILLPIADDLLNCNRLVFSNVG